MALSFKEQVLNDSKLVFHNAEEFAEKIDIYYQGKDYFIPVIMDYDGSGDRKKPSGDNSEGIFQTDLTVYINCDDINVIPKKGREIEVGGVLYTILKSVKEFGEIILELGVYEE